MNRLFLLRIVLGLAIALAGMSPAANADQDGEIRDREHIVIVPFGDTQRIFEQDGRGGYARISAIVEDERSNGDNVIVVHAGNAFAPSLFSTIDGGAHAIDMLNRLGITIMGVGHHEFDLGRGTAALRFAEARFPVVMSNARAGNGSPIAGTVRRQIVAVAGYRLGFMGLLPPQTSLISSPGDLVIEDPVAAAERVAGELRADGADIVIALTDLEQSVLSAIRARGAADLIFNAQGPTDSSTLTVEAVGSTVLARSGEGGNRIPVVDLYLERVMRELVSTPTAPQAGDDAVAEFDPDKFFEAAHEEAIVRWRVDVRVRDTARIEPDRFADIVLAQYYAVFGRQLNEPLATVAGAFDTLRANVRNRSSGFAAFVTEAMRDAAGADVAVLNAGAIRGDQTFGPGDEFRVRDLLTALPYRNRIVTLEITGRRLMLLLEHGLGPTSVGGPRFVHFAGMSVRYNPGGRPGARVCRVTINGKPLEHGANYVVATNEFLARGGDGYDMLGRAATVDRGDLLDFLRQRLTETGKLQPIDDDRLTPSCF
ncbi:MAG: bifunctional UDP-sugar hydrolase/5'-nucleotidase [Alphaproteobacteria bacterium]